MFLLQNQRNIPRKIWKGQGSKKSPTPRWDSPHALESEWWPTVLLHPMPLESRHHGYPKISSGWWLIYNNSGYNTNNSGYIWLYDGIYIYMVLYLLLWQMMEWKSVGMMKFPIYGKIKIVPNHQPDIYIYLSRWINYSHPIKIWLDPMQLTWPCHITCVALYRWCIRRGFRNRPLRGCIQNPNETCEKNVSFSLSPWDL